MTSSLFAVIFFSMLFFFFNDTATTEIYTLSLHDALPISPRASKKPGGSFSWKSTTRTARSEEHTSELQSHLNLVCRLLLEKKKKHKCSTRYKTTITRKKKTRRNLPNN